MGHYLNNVANRLDNTHVSPIETDIKFRKTGADITQHIAGAVAELEADIVERVKAIDAICKVRDVTVEEVLEGAEDRRKYEAYELKMSSNLPTQARGILAALQADLDTLKNESRAVIARKRQCANLKRVYDNLDEDVVYALSYDELVQFGY